MANTICRASITLRDGRTIYASAYGKRAFCWNVEDRSTETENPPAQEEVSEEVNAS